MLFFEDRKVDGMYQVKGWPGWKFSFSDIVYTMVNQDDLVHVLEDAFVLCGARSSPQCWVKCRTSYCENRLWICLRHMSDMVDFQKCSATNARMQTTQIEWDISMPTGNFMYMTPLFSLFLLKFTDVYILMSTNVQFRWRPLAMDWNLGVSGPWKRGGRCCRGRHDVDLVGSCWVIVGIVFPTIFSPRGPRKCLIVVTE